MLKRYEKINASLYNISHAVNVTTSHDELFASIHRSLSPIIDTTNFFIALYDKSNDSISFPYTVDTVDEFYPPVIEISKVESLTAKVIRTSRQVLMNKSEILREREESTLRIPLCSPSEIWLGVPLLTREEIVGVMAVQSYQDPHCYDRKDLDVMVSVADQVAIAIDRRNKEDQLLASEAKFRRIVTTANEGIMILNCEWHITHTNDHLTEMLGYASQELIGKPFETLLFDEDMDDFLYQKEQRTHGAAGKFERRFKKKDGQMVWTIVSDSAIFNNAGQFDGSFGMITDISKRKIAEFGLQKKNAELQEAMEQIQMLRGILPICSHCKKIRDDKGYWSQLKTYISKHSEAYFSHSICPECAQTHYPDFDIYKD